MSASRKAEIMEKVQAIPLADPAGATTVGRFVDFYNYRRYHKALKDIIPADMLAGQRDKILGRRREAKDRTINRRKLSNQALREQLKPA